MQKTQGVGRLGGISRLALAAAIGLAGSGAMAQATGDTSAANPAPAQAASDAAAATNNAAGVGAAPDTSSTRGATAAAPADAGVGEIVVTAQFREQNLQDTPLAITAISSAMLEARSQTNIQDVAAQAPSVTLKSNAPSYGPSLVANIRGVGQSDFNPALEPGVGLYVDDVYYATLTGSVLDLLDLDRVEVLRGPQGTLAGRNSIGGAIKLYSKKPIGDDSGSIQATYGSRNRIDVRASYDLGITSDLSARLAIVSRHQDGYIDRLDYGCVNPNSGIPATRNSGNCLLSKEGEINYQGLRGQLRYHPSDKLDINIAGDYTRDNRTVAGAVLTYANYKGVYDINPFSTPQPYNLRFYCGKYCNYASFTNLADGSQPYSSTDDRIDFKGYGFSSNIDWKLLDTLQLVSITGYRAYTSIFSNDDDLSPLAHSLGGPNKLTFDSISQELRLNGSFADKAVNYTIGGYYEHQMSRYRSIQALRYSNLNFYSNDPVPAGTKAVFAQASWAVTSKLTATGGIRYSDEFKDYTFARLDINGNPVAGSLGALNGVTGHYHESRPDYRANLQYDWTDNFMTYGQFSTGFKGGGVNPRPFDAAQVQPFGPETLKTYELGAKATLFDRMLRLNGAAFYSQYKGIQLSLNTCPQYNPPGVAAFPCALLANVGDAHIKGFEVEANLRPMQGLLIDSALSYVHFNYTYINPGAGGPTNLSGPQYGMVSPYSPKWKYSAGIQYEIPAGDIGSITPRVDGAYQSTIYTNAVNGPYNRIASYALFNARLTWRNAKKDWEASFEVTNLTNKYYFLTAFDLSVAAGLASAQPGRPREWALTLKKKF